MSMHAETNLETVVSTLPFPCADSLCSAGSTIRTIQERVWRAYDIATKQRIALFRLSMQIRSISTVRVVEKKATGWRWPAPIILI